MSYVQVPLEDLQQASSYLVQALEMRKRYMEMSQQSYATITARFVRSTDANAPAYVPSVHVQKHIAGKEINLRNNILILYPFVI